MKYFIFDFDGVIADTWELGIQALIDLGEKNDREEALQFRTHHFSTRPVHQRDKDGINQDDMQKLKDRTLKMNQYFVEKGVPLFEGFVVELQHLHSVTMAVVSSGSRISVVPNAQKTGLPFTHILSLEDGHSKEDKIMRICKDWKVKVNDVYYFTDTLSDVYELENYLDRTKIIGCAWGYLGYDALRTELPDGQILKQFTDIHRLFVS